MEKKINDISLDFDKDLDISDIHKNKFIEVLNTKENSTNDLKKNLGNFNMSGRKKVGLHKLKNTKFDSITNNSKLQDINLAPKKSPKEKQKYIYKPKVKKIKRKKFTSHRFFTKNVLKKIGIVSLITIGVLFLDKIVVENRINEGYSKLISIKNNSGDINYIQKNINSARFDFILSDILFKPFLLISNTNISNGYYILEGGKNITKLLDEGIQTFIAIKEFISNKGKIEDIEFTNLLVNLQDDFANITNLLYEAIITYDKVGILPNDNLNQKLILATNKLKEAYHVLDILNKDYDQFLNLFGHTKEKKYLIIFQNNDEIRATGGFMGSLATVTLKNGKVTNFNNDDIYAYEWEVNKVFPDKEPAPEGLNKITDTFGLRDANYSIDFGSSSRKINFFLEKINKNVDGIIYINQNTIFDFLKLTGGVEFSKLSEKITEKNFSLIISTLVEAQAFKVGTLGSPKQILFDFAFEFIEKLKKDKNFYAYLDIISKNIKSRDIVIYSFNTDENNLLWKLGLNGTINYSDSLDFSYPVFTSVGGNKSDRYIELKYKKDILQNNDCSIDTNLQIFRTHFFSKFEEQKVEKLLDKYPIKDKSRADIINIQGKGVNKSYVRLLLPKNAIVTKTKGINITEFPQAIMVDFYINTRLLETTNINIDYTIPNRECEPYDFKFYKQPGIRDYKIEINNSGNIRKIYDFKSDYYYYQKTD